MLLRPKKKLTNRLQRDLDRRERVANALQGEGLYIWKNNTKGDLYLPKPSKEGMKVIPAGCQFTGDSYFEKMMKTNEVVQIRTIQERNVMSEEKLILDQPDFVTSKGKLEHVITQATPKKEEVKPVEGTTTQETLLTDDAMDGVEIILE